MATKAEAVDIVREEIFSGTRQGLVAFFEKLFGPQETLDQIQRSKYVRLTRTGIVLNQLASGRKDVSLMSNEDFEVFAIPVHVLVETRQVGGAPQNVYEVKMLWARVFTEAFMAKQSKSSGGESDG